MVLSKAWCSINPLSDYVGRIGLSIDWNDNEISDKNIKKSAFHEVLHFLLHRLKNCGESRYINEDEIHEAEHETIRRIVNMEFKD